MSATPPQRQDLRGNLIHDLFPVREPRTQIDDEVLDADLRELRQLGRNVRTRPRYDHAVETRLASPLLRCVAALGVYPDALDIDEPETLLDSLSGAHQRNQPDARQL